MVHCCKMSRRVDRQTVCLSPGERLLLLFPCYLRDLSTAREMRPLRRLEILYIITPLIQTNQKEKEKMAPGINNPEYLPNPPISQTPIPKLHHSHHPLRRCSPPLALPPLRLRHAPHLGTLSRLDQRALDLDIQRRQRRRRHRRRGSNSNSTLGHRRRCRRLLLAPRRRQVEVARLARDGVEVEVLVAVALVNAEGLADEGVELVVGGGGGGVGGGGGGGDDVLLGFGNGVGEASGGGEVLELVGRGWDLGDGAGDGGLEGGG